MCKKHSGHICVFSSTDIPGKKSLHILHMRRLWRWCHCWKLYLHVRYIQKWTFESGRQRTLMMTKIQTLIMNNQVYVTRDIAEILQISQMSVLRHLETLRWITTTFCTSLFNGKNNGSHFHSRFSIKINKIIHFQENGHRWWKMYYLQQSVAKKILGKTKCDTVNYFKGSPHSNELLLCIWLDWNSVVYYE